MNIAFHINIVREPITNPRQPQYLFLILLICSFLNSKSQFVSDYILTYNEKTIHIYTNYDSLLYLKKVNLYIPFVQFRNCEKDYIKEELHGQGFNSKKAMIDSNYVRNMVNEKTLSNFYYNTATARLKHFINCSLSNFSSQDSTFVLKELNTLKELLKDSVVKDYTMSDELYTVLKKNNGDQQIVMDVVMYQADFHYQRSTNNWSLVKFFVFDMRSKKLAYYNYKLDIDHNHAKWYNLDGQKYYYSVMKKYENYLRENKKYLIRIAKKT